MAMVKTVQATIVKFLLIGCSLLYTCSIEAQQLPKHALQVVGGVSRHGSGDLKGIAFGTEYIQFLSHRFSLNYNFRGSINQGKETIIVTNNTTGSVTDASVRFTTAGVQLGVNAGLSIIRSRRHDFKVSLGPFGRYQSASNGDDGYAIYGPQATGIPAVLIGYDNRTPQNIFTIGAILQLQYDYTFKNKMYAGILPGFQTDTNGDVLPQVGLTVGKRF